MVVFVCLCDRDLSNKSWIDSLADKPEWRRCTAGHLPPLRPCSSSRLLCPPFGYAKPRPSQKGPRRPPKQDDRVIRTTSGATTGSAFQTGGCATTTGTVRMGKTSISPVLHHCVRRTKYLACSMCGTSPTACRNTTNVIKSSTVSTGLMRAIAITDNVFPMISLVAVRYVFQVRRSVTATTTAGTKQMRRTAE